MSECKHISTTFGDSPTCELVEEDGRGESTFVETCRLVTFETWDIKEDDGRISWLLLKEASPHSVDPWNPKEWPRMQNKARND